MRKTPIATSMASAIMVQMMRLATPYRSTIPYTITMKAPVGPPTATRVPPSAETRKPATIAVMMPASGFTPNRWRRPWPGAAR